MNELALFAGAGGGILGGKLLGWRTVCAVEIDPYCREILLRRQEDGSIGPFPVWDDVRTFDGEPWRGVVDIVSAGFPCQPFSVAGSRRGEDDDRNMWPETKRILDEVRPRLALLENVPGLISTPYWGTILGDLAEIGFDAEWCVVSAAECGAPHRRQRVWLLAHAEVEPVGARLCQGEPEGVGRRRPGHRRGERDIPDANSTGRPQGGFDKTGERPNGGESDPISIVLTADAGGPGPKIRQGSEAERTHPAIARSDWWAVEPDVGRVAYGVAYRVDRLKALENGQVPAVVREAFGMIQNS